jgi:KaiC/GvpD/RAD55 family RecA-like ATPase|tara:strand:+ start:1279 stop:2682 length:1404 start_codon:yes stop_codon:yes gene_type:complete
MRDNTEAREYNLELQTLFVEFIAHNKDLFVRVNGILDSAYFDRGLRKTIEFLQEHAAGHGALPTAQQIEAVTGVKLVGVGDKVNERHIDWFIDEFEQFCKQKALEGAILKSTDLLEKGEFGAVEKLVKDAVQLGLTKHMGTDYWDNPAERIQRVRDQRGAASTGWATIDFPLYGGFNQGELNIFAASSGGGKSLFLQNLALNWSLLGHNVVYITLELSEELCAMRLDSMLTGYSTKEVFAQKDDTHLKVKMEGKNAGSLQLIQMPNGITVNDITSYIKEYEVQTNVKVDAVLLDYLDLMSPAQTKVSASDLFIKDKFVSEELRNFAVENQYLFATASQLNRSAVEEVEFDHSHMAGGISKVHTADNVIGIFTSQAMRERGRYQIQFMKTRSSAGLGQKIDLKFDIKGLRITDLDKDEEGSTMHQPTQIYDKLKKKTQLKSQNSLDVPPEKSATEQTDRFRSILKKQD